MQLLAAIDAGDGYPSSHDAPGRPGDASAHTGEQRAAPRADVA
jgi:hypothetical protein